MFQNWLTKYKKAPDEGQEKLRHIAENFSSFTVNSAGIKNVIEKIEALKLPSDSKLAGLNKNLPKTVPPNPFIEVMQWVGRKLRKCWIWCSLFILKSVDLAILVFIASVVGLITLWEPNPTWESSTDIMTALIWRGSVKF